MSSLNADDVMDYAQTLEGVELFTLARNRPFTLHVLPTGIQFVPSSGTPRHESRMQIQEFCEQYAQSGSKSESAYKTFNASYLVAVVTSLEERITETSDPNSVNSSSIDSAPAFKTAASAQSPEDLVRKAAEEIDATGYFIPKADEDACKRVWREIAERRGQSRFREQLIDAYRKRCAVTGCRVLAVLEAAHIRPFSDDMTFEVQNGILLRADIHSLFDLNLLGINPDDFTVSVSDSIRGTTYGKLHGQPLRLPHTESLKPAKEFLRIRWLRFWANSSEHSVV